MYRLAVRLPPVSYTHLDVYKRQLLFNVVFDPLFGYFYKLVILGKPAAEVTLSINIAATSINAVLSVIVATAVYMALRPVLAKSNMLPRLGKESACA